VLESDHLFALDPPPFPSLEALLHAGGRDGASFVHLAWGPAELAFAGRAIEHEFGLRASLAAIYRALAAHPDGLGGAPLEGLLTGSGDHPRSPALVGRCLRVLSELRLVELEDPGATVRCKITGRGRAELERSPAFKAYAALREEGLKYLSEPAQPTRRASAA
jgi:hypothetical protein